MIEFIRLPTATPRAVAALRRPAAGHPQRLLHAGRHRPRPLSHRGVVRHRQPRLAGVLFFLPQATYRLLGLFDLVFLVPELLLLAGRDQQRRAARWRRSRRRRGPDAPSGAAAGAASRSRCSSSWAPRRRSWSTSASSARSRRPTSRPTRIISCSDRSAPRRPKGVPYWIWLVLPRVFPDLLPAPGGYASLGFAREGRPRDADRPLEGDGRLSARRHQLRRSATRPATAPGPDEPPTIVAAAASHQTSPQQYFRFLFAAAADPRFNADTMLGRDRAEHAALADGSAALSVRDHPARRAARCCSSATRRTAGCARGPTGAAAGSIRSTR